MISNQRHKFFIDSDITWLNGSYMSPQLKAVEAIGIESVKRKSNPWAISPIDFFNEVAKVKNAFARLIHADKDRVALIPSVSYGIANAARNIKFKQGDEIILVDQLFPSNYFIWKKLADDLKLKITMVKAPDTLVDRGAKWNDALLSAINAKTRVVSMEQTHWTDGTLFDLTAVRNLTSQVGALLILDGTQSIGAYPFDQSMYKVDALIAGGYKWLLGPYSIGMAYYGDTFDQGDPIEHNWINKRNSETFEKLTDYEEEFKPGAARYSMGEQSQFVNAPMLRVAIEQLIEWGQDTIQAYTGSLINTVLPILEEKKIWIENTRYRGNHLFGLRPTYHMDSSFKNKLIENKVFVSYRGDSIRVSPNVYNTEEEMMKLVSLL